MRLALVTVALVFTLIAALPAQAQVTRWGDYGGPVAESGLATEVLGLENVTQIDAGNADGYAIESDGSVHAWGSGAFGALGNNTLRRSDKAVKVSLPAGVKAVSLGEAERSGFAVTSTGNVYAWGMNKHGDLCLGEEQEIEIRVPQEIPGLSNAIAVQGAKNHILILLANGTVDVCGHGSEGELGLGPATREVDTPTPVPGVEHVVELSAGPLTSAVRTASGEVLEFGSNREGEEGLGTRVIKTFTPTHLPLPGAASSISVGGDGGTNEHSEALVEGVPYGWGFDEAGEIADGSTLSKFTPVVASELTTLSLASLKASGHSTVALTNEGTAYALGATGELGNGNGQPSLTPLPVATEVTEISATAHDQIARSQ
ncbi:MAG TPA: hypothetical protein VK272_09790 [Solirubrobacteraceae bacterium]|nr:hypothetical protein [Solirubrobacteraceae bacterium]